MNTTEQQNHSTEEMVETYFPKKRSKWKILLFIIWLAVVITWLTLIANM